MTDRCSIKGCREPVSIKYLGKLYCDRHWIKASKDSVKMGKVGDGLYEFKNEKPIGSRSINEATYCCGKATAVSDAAGCPRIDVLPPAGVVGPKTGNEAQNGQ